MNFIDCFHFSHTLLIFKIINDGAKLLVCVCTTNQLIHSVQVHLEFEKLPLLHHVLLLKNNGFCSEKGNFSGFVADEVLIFIHGLKFINCNLGD